VTLFHVVDAGQTLAAFVLRAWRVAAAPMFIFAGCLWGVGLGGGYALAFDVTGWTPAPLRGAPGYWAAASAGLMLATALLMALLARVMRRQKKADAATAAAAAAASAAASPASPTAGSG
jgi:MATE family multidrug resistance protein